MMNLVKKEKGFTLIELMIVVAIIGILAAIAIPQFASYRVKAFNASAQSDLRTAQTTFEVFFNDNDLYPPTEALQTGAITLGSGTSAVTLNTSSGVWFSSGTNATGQAYNANSKHLSGDITFSSSSSSSVVTETAGTAGAKQTAAAAP